MKDNKLVEKYDDNPGAYFEMLVESLLDEDSYSSNGSDNRQVNFSKGSYAGKSEWSSNSKYGSSGKSYSDDWGSKKYQTTDKDKASDSYYKQNQKAQDDMKKNGNAVEEISKLSKDVADYTERKMETIQINGSSVQCKGVGDINNFKKRLLKHGYKEEKASGDWNSIFANDKVSNAKLGITNKGAVVLFYQNPQKESLTEDKFVPQDKMSKKAQKELNDKKRGTWGNTNPVTKVQPNKKAYDRKRDKKIVDESLTEDSEVFKDMSNALDDIEYLCNDTYNWDINGWNNKENVRRTAERIIESAQILLDSIERY